MKRILEIFCLLLWLAGPGAAQEIPLPDPTFLGQNDSVAIFVVRARPDDVGFRQLFSTGLAGARKQKDQGSLASALNSVLSQKSQESLLRAALPLQWVRVDQPGQPRLRSTTALTVAGWRGLQGLLYQSMVAGPDGQPFEVRQHKGEEIVLRPGWRTSAGPRVLTRVRGTFINSSTPDLARFAIDRLLAPPRPALKGPLWEAYSQLAGNQDVSGVLLNQQGSLRQILAWAGGDPIERVRRRVGLERFERAVDSVVTAAWEADVVSDDRIDLDLRFITARPDQVQELSLVWEEIRQSIKALGRLGDYRLTRQQSGVDVHLSLIGFREAVGEYLGTLKL